MPALPNTPLSADLLANSERLLVQHVIFHNKTARMAMESRMFFALKECTRAQITLLYSRH